MSKAKLYTAAAIAGMTGALFGYSVGFIGGVLVLPSFLRHFHLDTLPSSDLARAQSAIVSSWIVGAFFGVPSGIPICSRYGRKRCLMFSATCYVLGAVLQVINAGSSLGLFEVGRLLNGFGVGAGTLVSPI
jgi:MFS family permease